MKATNTNEVTDPVAPIQLTARIADPIHFVFVAETWAEQLKPYKQAEWTHDSECYSWGSFYRCPHNYTLKSGHFLVFPQFHMTQGGFYAAHLFMICKELAEVTMQVKATLTVEGLTLEAVDARTLVHLKPRGLSRNDVAHHAILGY